MNKINKDIIKNIVAIIICISVIASVIGISRSITKNDGGYTKTYKIRCGLPGDDKTTIYNGKYKIEEDVIYIKGNNNKYMFSVESCYIQFKED